ncbi:MAG: [protein-PII] uridylyltransferase [Desulfatitalea sp.]|nr:[protein-PII] uridylyltransferase [Desulfatitalea sp.]
MRPVNNIIEARSPADVFKCRRTQLFATVDSTGAEAFLNAHATAVDEYFMSSFAHSAVGPDMGIMRNPCALIALGGYGRAEQCVHSDIDLLFLFDQKVPAEAEALVREIIYPLWDLGLEVGHATRSIKECIQLARQDLEVFTSLLDARFVCGMSPLYHQLMERMRVKLINVKPAQLVAWLLETNQTRHDRFGDSAYLLEPNLKEGQGGLRDYHTMLWIARIHSDAKLVRDLEYFGYLSNAEYQELTESLDFVWTVRNQLHLLLGRKCDQLHLEHQTRLAEAMQIRGYNGHLPVERLLGDLHGRMEFIKQCYRVFIYELDQKKRLKRKNKAMPETPVEGLKFNRGMLNFVSPEAVVQEPLLLARIFVESAVHKAPLSAEARRLVREFSHLVANARYRCAAEVVEAFEKVLARPMTRFNALNAMLETGFLVAFIPAFKGVVNRIQFDQYHLYPVARHLLLAVTLLKNNVAARETGQDPLGASLYQELRSKRALLWAALLHDIGKAEPASGHSERGAKMAARICAEKGLSSADIDTVEFLVREHLLLFETASRRDINDEETALMVARRVGKPERLKMLYLLSVADAMATGPKAWNDWTASLMRSLFLKTLNVMEKGELVSRKAIRVIEEKRERVLEAVPTADAQQAYAALLQVMSPRYLLYAPSGEIPRHMDLCLQLKSGDKAFVWRIDPSEDNRTRTLTVCAKDRPGLLSRIAGVLTLNGIDILDARIFTWRNNVALDIFEVTPPPDPLFETERWERAAGHLQSALHDQLDLSGALARKQDGRPAMRAATRQRPQQVIIDNESSSFFTIIEVIAWDFPGLLYRVTDAIFRCRLDIWVAKSASRVDQVVDVFYVRSFDGEKVDNPEEEAAICRTIEAVLH